MINIGVVAPSLHNLSFSGNPGVVENVEYTPVEYCLYVLSGTRKLIIKHADYLPCTVSWTMVLTASATLTDVFDTMRWDISSDNSVYTLANNSKNQSRMLLFGLTWNFNSYRQVKSAKAGQEEDLSMLRIGD